MTLPALASLAPGFFCWAALRVASDLIRTALVGHLLARALADKERREWDLLPMQFMSGKNRIR
jgi:hypothetical protein